MIDRGKEKDKETRKGKRSLVIFLLLLIGGLIAIAVEIKYIGIRSDYLLNNIIFLALVNINLILLMVIILLVGRNLIKLYFERRQKIPGSKFRIKLVVAFVGLSLIPSTLLFILATGLFTNIIEHWFSTQVEGSLRNSLDVAQEFYRNMKDNTLSYAYRLSNEITEQDLLKKGNEKNLAIWINDRRKEYGVTAIEVYSPQLSGLAKSVEMTHRKNISETTKQDFLNDVLSGNKVSEIFPSKGGEMVKAAIPILKNNEVAGIIVVTTSITKDVVAKMSEIRNSIEEFTQLKSVKSPIRFAYIIVFLLATLLIIFSATWIALYIAKGITIPIQRLAEATHSVAQGNLDVQIDVEAKDELKMLVDSFNQMTKDLKIGNDNIEKINLSLRKANIELDQALTYMETVLEDIATGVISIDKDGRITTINKAAEHILGISGEDLQDKEYTELFRFVESEKIITLIEKMRKYRKDIDTEITLSINKRVMTLHLNISTLRDKEENLLGTLVVFDDLTELIKAQRTAAWQEVARRIAHEVKNPLTPIQLSAQRLKKKYAEGSPDYQAVLEECTSTIIKEVYGIKSLIDEFSRFARMPEAKLVPQHINEVIEDVVALYRSAHKYVNIIVEAVNSPPMIKMDKDQIKRVFLNLFENAIEAMNNRGNIWVTTTYDPEMTKVRIDIADDGSGIPSEDKDKLFLPYFSKKKGGTGLGLAIVDKIITDHGGNIRISDREPKGTVFTIELPAYV
ncbi:MAG: ATP-binding protein [Nitrospirota bacterium]